MTKQNAVSGVVGAIQGSDDVPETVETNGSKKRGKKYDGQRVWDTLELCKANPVPDMDPEKCDVFEVTRPDGSVVYVWAFHAQAADHYVARLDGYTSTKAEGKRGGGRSAKETVGAGINTWSEQQLRDAGISDVLINAILAARQNGSSNAAGHVKASDDQRDNAPATAEQHESKPRRRNR